MPSGLSRVAAVFAKRSAEDRVTGRPAPPAPAPLAPPMNEESAWRRGSRAVGEGLLLTLLQIFLVCLIGTYRDGALSPRPAPFLKAYVDLVQFDSKWYWSIAEDGYRMDRAQTAES